MSPWLLRLFRRLNAIEKRLVEQDQRIARTVMHGKVKAVREKNGDWQVRLDLGQDPQTGDAVLGPWTPVQPASAGALKIKVKPTEGERMTMLSPSGVVGSGSWAIRGPFDNDHPAPAGDEDVVIERGKSRISIEDGKVVIATGDARLELDGSDLRINGELAITGGKLTHNQKDISHLHKHRDVFAGLGLSGPPV